ncbi:CotS family spore coat protein [Cohnella sp.]|uniref:CotS family spore coat protein n=1 Tax=Cohnella sp. TaxID=1883426 RepID=UPI00356813B5
MSAVLIRLAEQVLAEYAIGPRSVRLVQATEMKAIWKVSDGTRVYGLKRLKYGKEKMLFAIQAQKHLQDQGGPVPHLIRTKQGQLYAERDGQIFILYAWAEGRAPSFSNPTDLQKSVQLLARFHKASTGFSPPIPCLESTKLGKWPLQYESMKTHFHEWQTSTAFPGLSASLKSHWKDLIRLAENAQAALSRSEYENMVRNGPKTLCHQDYSEGNALLNGKGGVVLDMDSITYDFPARDLRKVILKRMSERGKWDPTLFNNILSWYKAVNPLSSDQLRLVYIDLSFPHLFHETAKNPFRKNSSVSAAKLLAAIRIEKEKEEALQIAVRARRKTKGR